MYSGIFMQIQQLNDLSILIAAASLILVYLNYRKLREASIHSSIDSSITRLFGRLPLNATIITEKASANNVPDIDAIAELHIGGELISYSRFKIRLKMHNKISNNFDFSHNLMNAGLLSPDSTKEEAEIILQKEIKLIVKHFYYRIHIMNKILLFRKCYVSEYKWSTTQGWTLFSESDDCNAFFQNIYMMPSKE
jgi:hypothetical protein